MEVLRVVATKHAQDESSSPGKPAARANSSRLVAKESDGEETCSQDDPDDRLGREQGCAEEVSPEPELHDAVAHAGALMTHDQPLLRRPGCRDTDVDKRFFSPDDRHALSGHAPEEQGVFTSEQGEVRVETGFGPSDRFAADQHVVGERAVESSARLPRCGCEEAALDYPVRRGRFEDGRDRSGDHVRACLCADVEQLLQPVGPRRAVIIDEGDEVVIIDRVIESPVPWERKTSLVLLEVVGLAVIGPGPLLDDPPRFLVLGIVVGDDDLDPGTLFGEFKPGKAFEKVSQSTMPSKGGATNCNGCLVFHARPFRVRVLDGVSS